MSKITPKNLHYSSTLPPFLARLRGETPSGPDPILAAQRRPTKQRSGSAEAEDAPIVVDEEGNVVDVKVGVDGAVTSDNREDVTNGEGSEGKGESKEGTGEEGKDGKDDKGVEVGGRKKRKVGRVVGGEQEEEEKDKEEKGVKGVKGKKKAKKIKLSFGDEEG
ncbi:hypothetical protein OQA88_5849 [Cercophora sp. LCS_1]